jgi:hypothetical protein
MKPTEEQKSIRIQMISFLCMFGLTIFMSFTDYKINTFASEVNDLTLTASDDLQQTTKFIIQSFSTTMYQMYQLESLPETNKKSIADEFMLSVNSQVLQDPTMKALTVQLNNGEITLREYFASLTTYLNTLTIDNMNKYTQDTAIIANKKSNGTIWTTIKVVIYPLQILALLVLAREYYKLMNDISKRITHTEKQKGKTTSPKA